MARALLVVVMSLAVSTAAAAEKIVKEHIAAAGKERTCYVFVPDSAKAKPSPLVLTLHGSGRDGRILVDHWQGLAKKEGIILGGLDATDRRFWQTLEDGPDVLHDLVEALKAKYSIDPRRVYLFGHSAGAIHGMHMGLLESEYFAAVAAHAGVVQQEFGRFAKQAPRKIPIAIWVGTNDRLFPLDAVRATRDALNSIGFAVELTEISGHTHDYYGRSSQINKDVWEFLKKHQLAADPKYQEYAKQAVALTGGVGSGDARAPRGGVRPAGSSPSGRR